MCTGAGTGSGSTRFRRLWCRDRSGSTGFRKSREGSRKPGCKAKSGSTGSTGLRRRFRRRSGRRQVRLNRVPDKVPEKLLGSLGAKPSQVQRVPEKVAEKVPEKVLGIFGAGPGQVPTGSKGFECLVSQHASERFVKIEGCGCWGYHRSLLFPSVTISGEWC